MLKLAVAVAVSVAVGVAAQETFTTVDPHNDCARVEYHGTRLDPNTWRSPGTFHMEYKTAAGSLQPAADLKLSLCDSTGSTLAASSLAPKGYAAVGPVFNNVYTFNQHLYHEMHPNGLVYHFGSTYPDSAGAYLHVNISCCSACADSSLMLLSHTITYFNNSWDASKPTMTVQFGSKDVCVAPTTQMTTAPIPTLPPTTTMFGPTTAAPAGPTTPAPTPAMDTCTPLTFNGKTVHPNNWAAASSDRITVAGLANSSSYWAIDLCSADMASANGKRGYVISQPLVEHSPIQDNSYKWKLWREVRQDALGYDVEIVWHFGSEFTDDFIHVHVTCGPAMFLSFSSTVFTAFPHADNKSFTYRAYLHTNDLCTPRTTIAPSQKCAPFQLTPVQDVDPRRWGPLRGTLVMLQTGTRFSAMIDMCHVPESAPEPRGYVIFRGLNKSHANESVAFDLFERADYYEALAQYRARYQSTVSPDVLNDRVEVTVTCDPSATAAALAFRDQFVFSFRNELGGLTYQVQLKSAQMCPRAPTLPPWLTTTRAATTTAPAMPTAAPTMPAPSTALPTVSPIMRRLIKKK